MKSQPINSWLCVLLLWSSLATLHCIQADYTGHLLQALSFTECRRDCITRCERYASTVPGNMELCVGCLKECISVFAQQANAVKAEIAAVDFSSLLGYERSDSRMPGMRAPRALAAQTAPTTQSTTTVTTTAPTTTTSPAFQAGANGRQNRNLSSRPPRAANGKEPVAVKSQEGPDVGLPLIAKP